MRTYVEYPIGVQLFNRPEFAQQLLQSLRSQNLEISPQNLVVLIDGYRGSLDEKHGINDSTNKVREIVDTYCPNSTIISLDKNLGIGRSHELLQGTVFNQHQDKEWAIFLEEDSLPAKDYLDVISQLISAVGSNRKIVKVSTFQILNYREVIAPTESKVYAGRGTKAYAERASWFNERKESYLAALNLMLSEDLSKLSKFVELAKLGIFMENLQKDDLLDRLIILNEKIHLTYPTDSIKDIGITGSSGFVEEEYNLHATVLPLEFRQISEFEISEILEQQDKFITTNFARIFSGYLLAKNSCSLRAIVVEKLKKLLP